MCVGPCLCPNDGTVCTRQRLQHFIENWEWVTRDQWVLNMVRSLVEIPLASRKGCIEGGETPPRGGIPLQVILSHQKRRGLETSHQPEGTEQLCQVTPFQNGGNTHSQGSTTTWMLVDKADIQDASESYWYTRITGSTCNSHPRARSISSPTSLWAPLSTVGFYQYPEAGSSSCQTTFSWWRSPSSWLTIRCNRCSTVPSSELGVYSQQDNPRPHGR